MPKGSRQVSAIGFSCNDKFLAACDMSDKLIVHVFDLTSDDQAPVSDVQINEKVLHLAWNPFEAKQFATVGKDHMILCNFSDGKTKSNKGSMGNKLISHSSVAWSQNPSNSSTLFTGGADGKVHIWNGATLGKAAEVCKGAVHSVCSVFDNGTEMVYAGGNDKNITILKLSGKVLEKTSVIEADGVPRSIDVFNGSILCGLKSGNIVTSTLKEAKLTTVLRSHCDGECWGLEVIHLDGGEIRILSAADDNRILAYDLTKRGALAEGLVNIDAPTKKKKKKKAVRGGASSMSSLPAEC